MTKNISIFASGAGSNAEKIIEYFKTDLTPDPSPREMGEEMVHIEVALILCNKPGAGVLKIAEKNNIPILMIEKEKFFRGSGYVDELKKENIDLIVLAGFLWKIPEALIKAFPNKIINIHPALLPKYGGKGMFGENVHQAVIDNKEKESGITIHYVDGHYDNGDIIFRAVCPVMETDTASSLATRVHELEHKHYPPVIESLFTNKSIDKI